MESKILDLENIKEKLLNLESKNKIDFLNGILTINHKKPDQEVLKNLKDNANYIQKSQLYNIIKSHIRETALDMLLYKVKTQEDINLARTYIIVLEIIDGIINKLTKTE